MAIDTTFGRTFFGLSRLGYELLQAVEKSLDEDEGGRQSEESDDKRQREPPPAEFWFTVDRNGISAKVLAWDTWEDSSETTFRMVRLPAHR